MPAAVRIPPARAETLGLTRGEWQTLARLRTPEAVQAFLNACPPITSSTERRSCPCARSCGTGVRIASRARFVAACALWIHGEPPLLMHLDCDDSDWPHVVALFAAAAAGAPSRRATVRCCAIAIRSTARCASWRSPTSTSTSTGGAARRCAATPSHSTCGAPTRASGSPAKARAGACTTGSRTCGITRSSRRRSAGSSPAATRSSGPRRRSSSIPDPTVRPIPCPPDRRSLR